MQHYIFTFCIDDQCTLCGYTIMKNTFIGKNITNIFRACSLVDVSREFKIYRARSRRRRAYLSLVSEYGVVRVYLVVEAYGKNILVV